MSTLEERIVRRADRLRDHARDMHLALLVGQQMRIAQCAYFKTRDHLIAVTVDGAPIANGRLIAAAPELYEALLLCEAAIADHDPEPVEGTYWHKPLAQVRAALAKAVQP